MAGREATAADVAKKAGVSRTAVSFVLNDKDAGNIAPATRERILAAAQELGYVPHPVARSLRTQRTQMVGLITDAIATSPFAGQLLGGAADRARERGHLVAVFDSQERPALEAQAAEELRYRRVDGLLYAAMSLREVGEVPGVGLPTVLANCFDAADAHPSVAPDEVRAGEAVAGFLVGMGHRDIGVLISDLVLAGTLRLQGLRAGLARESLRPKVIEHLDDGWTIDAGYAATMRVLERDDRPTALFCVNDRVAAGAVLAATRLGLDVPGDLSVMGFDDQEELAANFVPGLTTMALPHRAMGEVAMDRLLDAVDGVSDPEPRRLLLESPLVRRESVGPPR